jgi:hypothetical protein
VAAFPSLRPLAPWLLVLAACGGPEPKAPPKAEEGVPANSISEARLKGNGITNRSASDPPANDPSQPYTQPMSGGAGGASPGGSAPDPKAPGKPSSKTGKVGKEECQQLFDRYIDLVVGTDSRFADIPPEMIAELKAQATTQARQQQGDPCKQEVSRTKYNCAIVASSANEWQKCMK